MNQNGRHATCLLPDETIQLYLYGLVKKENGLVKKQLAFEGQLI